MYKIHVYIKTQWQIWNAHKKLRPSIFSCLSCCFCPLLTFVSAWFVCVDKHISTHLFVGPDKTLPTFCPFCVCILDSTINTREDANTRHVLVRSLVYKKLCLGVFGHRPFQYKMETFVTFFLKRRVKNVLIFHYNWWTFAVRYTNVYIDMYRTQKNPLKWLQRVNDFSTSYYLFKLLVNS